jgi:hypothetical protein
VLEPTLDDHPEVCTDASGISGWFSGSSGISPTTPAPVLAKCGADLRSVTLDGFEAAVEDFWRAEPSGRQAQPSTARV